jgi:hypothetical protein
MAVSTLGFASRGGAILGMCVFGVRRGKMGKNLFKHMVKREENHVGSMFWMFW